MAISRQRILQAAGPPYPVDQPLKSRHLVATSAHDCIKRDASNSLLIAARERNAPAKVSAVTKNID
jgi:hypothetical protein